MKLSSLPLGDVLARVLETLDVSLASGSIANARSAVREIEVRRAQAGFFVAPAPLQREPTNESPDERAV